MTYEFRVIKTLAKEEATGHPNMQEGLGIYHIRTRTLEIHVKINKACIYFEIFRRKNDPPFFAS